MKNCTLCSLKYVYVVHVLFSYSLFVGYLVDKTSFITFTKKRETNIGKRVSTTSQNDKTQNSNLETEPLNL